ncbi:NADH-quinone oxidoreductase subunit L [Pseudovibrio exalbescens]|uniref:NADH-quinone oxidoreductase subunit L n=1 Tax=Pseudovibrio exalbescens TaxID=197461 RepID=UPI002365378F|nr:NADH-quinone oxidoreductase subunit L [Pseudovibrio exalbescens]MDD7909268.1 NADH-quinone oxidoreductase subunit L [Pseudovibrio exalbescens]
MSIISLVPLAAPLALVGAALVARTDSGIRPRKALQVTRIATVFALVIAVASALTVPLTGGGTSPLIGAAEFGLSIRLDALSAIMMVLVTFVGAIVVQYSRNYMDGDAQQGRFMAQLSLTVACVLLLVLSGNLVQLIVSWVITSLAFDRLLVFYKERAKARLAAKKKFIVARFGDLGLLVAVTLLMYAFGTSDIATILEAAGSMSEAPLAVTIATFLLVIAAITKSAQFPTHGWLTEVMETPTPVSALLHAGIINAGGFLIVRLADVMMLSSGALHILALVGGFTALFGAIVMLTQTSVKVSLAWSTVSQMGFMLLQCGLGLFSLAVLHIVTHSLYKAHAFLSSGSVVEIARASWVPDTAKPKVGLVTLGLAMALGLYVGVGMLFGLSTSTDLQVFAVGSILVMGLTFLFAQASSGRTSKYVLGRTFIAGSVISVAYFGLHALASVALGHMLPAPVQAGVLEMAIMALAVGSFAVVTFLQIIEPSNAKSAFWRAARIHAANGFYANAYFDRFVGALNRPAGSSN